MRLCREATKLRAAIFYSCQSIIESRLVPIALWVLEWRRAGAMGFPFRLGWARRGRGFGRSLTTTGLFLCVVAFNLLLFSRHDTTWNTERLLCSCVIRVERWRVFWIHTFHNQTVHLQSHQNSRLVWNLFNSLTFHVFHAFSWNRSLRFFSVFQDKLRV